MKTGKSLVELAQEITRRAEAKKDYIVDTSKVAVVPTDGGVSLAFGGEMIEINPLAHRQLGEALKIPAAYYDKMLKEDPRLLANNIETWFEKYPARRMVRTLDGKARAVLSDKYRPLEYEDLAEVALPILGELDLDVMSMDVTDTRLYIKAVDKKVTRELAKVGAYLGDGGHTIVRVAAPAITLTNSEVGLGRLAILAGYYDSWCSNLAMFGERSVKKAHVGARHDVLGGEEVYALLSDKSRKLNDAALWSSIGDVIRGAFDRVKFDALIDKVEGTQKDKIEDAVKAVDLTSKRFGLNEVVGKSILKHLIEGASLTRFGLLNAVTRASQDVEDYDVASDLEAIGGAIVELPQSEWRVIAEAA